MSEHHAGVKINSFGLPTPMVELDIAYAHQGVPLQQEYPWTQLFQQDWNAVLAVLDECDPGARQRPPTNGTQSNGLLFGLAFTASVGRTAPVFVEIGTMGGGSLRVLCAVAKRTGGHVYSIDPDEDYVRANTIPALEREGFAPYWTYIPGKSQDIEPRTADFLYVDGDHDYPAVCSDMARHAAAVRIGGVVLLDDVGAAFLGKLRWVVERWRDLQPLMVGPWAFWRHHPAFVDLYRADRSAGETVQWDLRLC